MLLLASFSAPDYAPDKYFSSDDNSSFRKLALTADRITITVQEVNMQARNSGSMSFKSLSKSLFWGVGWVWVVAGWKVGSLAHTNTL